MATDLDQTCGEYLVSYRERFAEAVRRGDSAVATARQFARVLDGLLGALYCAADSASRGFGHGDNRIALVAVGGYGRGLLGLHSDVDVLFVCDDPTEPRVTALAEGLLYPLWDLGVDIGHAVRGVQDTLALAREDLSTTTTLLDLRRIAGDRSIVEDLTRGARRQVFEPALDSFLRMLGQDAARRHERFGESLYLLEPEVKLGRGGLRDLDVANWAAAARWGSTEHVRTGALLEREHKALGAAQEMLWRVRNLLHLRARRKQDRLTFADQEEIAVELGFVDGVTLGVEQFMQAYYRHASVVAQTAERMLERAQPLRKKQPASVIDLHDGCALFDGHVTLKDTAALDDDPALAFRFYRQVSEQGRKPYGFARDAIARKAAEPKWCRQLRQSESARALFLTLIQSNKAVPVRRDSMLTELHEAGLTQAMIPELGPLMGRVQHDVYNVYTVDIHAVRATERLGELLAGKHAKKLTLATRLACEAPRRTPLFVALLLHVLGKVHGHRNPEAGARRLLPILERLGLSAVDADHVVWLVQEQGSLYHWATRRDTSDPGTLGELAEMVGRTARLRDLYLLTVCILGTTNPSAMSTWKTQMLDELYFALAARLEGRGDGVAGRAGELRREARVGIVGDVNEEALGFFIDAMPDRYVLANPVDGIRRHARAFRDELHAEVARRVAPGPSRGFSELMVLTKDRPGLLAEVAAVLAAHRVSVVDAQIYNVDHPTGRRAVDVFVVQRESQEDILADSLVAAIQSDLEARLAERITTEELVERVPKKPSWARKHSPDVPTEVIVDNGASARFTVVDVFTRDRLGVLHQIAKTMHEQGLTIALSKVNTEGDRVADVFYVKDAGGEKLRSPERLAELREVLEARLRAFHADAEASGAF